MLVPRTSLRTCRLSKSLLFRSSRSPNGFLHELSQVGCEGNMQIWIHGLWDDRNGDLCRSHLLLCHSGLDRRSGDGGRDRLRNGERDAAGAGVGAISGAVFSIEAVESSRDRWNSNGLGVWSILYLMDIIYSLLSGRLVREKVDPAMQSAVSSQISAISSPFVESSDFFDTGFVSGMPKDSIEELPKVKITKEDMVDKTGENICCSVCLQDLQIGDLARKLPNCVHMFHSRCIDSWLIRHGSCPLCRRDV
uniref:RING-type domain-containing protein n=1 Tax=Ananas comosus var. bracteatus TaxID=296719 RepID=A0A6V7PWN3_ANACO|nr:unnamed protein product [Ananas comosus var. bracteatus]